MTDLEMTKACALAMGYRADADGGFSRLRQGTGMDEPQWMEFIYDPLHFDEQAMALVKRFTLTIGFGGENWYVNSTTSNADLNRAIVECVAKMQAATAQPKPPSHYPPISAI